MKDAITAMREKLAVTGKMLYKRRLADTSGGNISARVGDKICLSPRYAGSKHRWQLTPDQVLVIDLEGNILEGDGQLSRETKVHLGLHREFGEHGTGVIHAHPHNLLAFCALGIPMPPVLEANLKFGEIPVIDYAPAHSPDLAANVVGAIRGNEARIRTQAAGVIAPWHGVFLIGKDIDAAFDAVERLDTNAYIILMTGRLADQLAPERAALAAGVARYKE
ncbi:MAG: class II aldolase/adducin family protein [Anaerolineae bacterium]|nr:class II aldolase/adducin family protein [Anaerolineae bacterium]